MTRPMVVDADGHVTESTEQLVRYMAPAYEAYGTSSRVRSYFPSDSWDRSVRGALGSSAPDAQTWLQAMDKAAVETAVLYPTNGLAIGWVREPGFAVALCQAYNDFLHEEFLKVSPRLKGVALIPLQDVPEAVKELQRAVTQLELSGAMLPAVGLRKPLGHPDFWPVYGEAQRLGCMLAVHATVRGPHYFGAELFDRFIEVHTVSHPFAQMMQLTSILFGGIPEKFPHLKLAFMESGCSWVPYWMGRMDEEWEKRGELEAPLCKRKPSEYIRSGRLFFHAESSEALLPQIVRQLGEDVLFYSSDYPHWDNEFPHNIQELWDREDVPESAKRKILTETARSLYGLRK